jgi:hypothetical protein
MPRRASHRDGGKPAGSRQQTAGKGDSVDYCNLRCLLFRLRRLAELHVAGCSTAPTHIRVTMPTVDAQPKHTTANPRNPNPKLPTEPLATPKSVGRIKPQPARSSTLVRHHHERPGTSVIDSGLTILPRRPADLAMGSECRRNSWGCRPIGARARPLRDPLGGHRRHDGQRGPRKRRSVAGD